MTDDRLDIDLNDLMVSEIEDIEEALGVPFDECFTAGTPKGKTLRALGWIVKRRENPDFTMDDAGSLRIVLKDDRPDPTPAATA